MIIIVKNIFFFSNKKDAFGWSIRLNTLKYSTKNEVAVPEPTNPLQINTNIKNNVILYRYERPYMYKFATAFGVLSLIGCLTMADSVYNILCKNLLNPNEDLMTNLVAHALPLGAIAVGILAGKFYFINMNIRKYWFLI